MRRRQLVVRFSDDEWELVSGRSVDAELAVGAWIGEVAVEVASGRRASVGLPDLLRLHSDVLRVEGLLAVDDAGREVLQRLIHRLDEAVDAVVAEVEAGRR